MALSDLLGRAATPNPDDERLEALCETVTQGLSDFVKVGDALAEIRDAQLYRRQAGTFEAFCRDRWGMTPQHAGRLMNAASICRQLEPTGSVPQSERQARELGTLDEETRLEAWTEAQESANEKGVVPARAVREAVAKRQPKKKRRVIKPARFRVPGATVVVEPNSKFRGWQESLEDAIAMAQDRAAPKRAA